MSLNRRIIDLPSPEKKQKTWKCRPRRSLDLPSGEEWKRYVDGFAIPQEQSSNARRHPAILHPTGPHNENSIDSNDIVAFSSSDDDDFNDVRPLVMSSTTSKETTSILRQPAKRKMSGRRRSCRNLVLCNSPDANTEVNITADSPAKPAKMRKTDIECEMNSPILKRKQVIQPSSSQDSNCSIREYSISDIESQTQTSTKESSQSTRLSEDRSASISVASSSSENDAQEVPLRSSEWLRNLQWIADQQNKQSDDDYNPMLEDSAKKKKHKFRPGGLADRLQKLVQRKQSTQNIWNHRMAAPQKIASDASKCLVVELHSIQVEFSMSVCRCWKVSPNQVDRQNEMTVLFTSSTAIRLALRKGSVVQIHPPWQTFDSAIRGKIIMCTFYCHLRDSPSNVVTNNNTASVSDEDPSIKDDQESGQQTLAVWACPCTTDGSFPRLTCPAQTSPYDTGLLLSPHSQAKSHESASPLCHLHTEISSQVSSHVDASILETIENQGGFGTCGISLQGTVQRVFYKSALPSCSDQTSRTQNKEFSKQPVSGRVSILLQDSTGTCCELVLPARCELQEQWAHLCEDGEGKLWKFAGLRQNCRVNKSRDPALFHVMESVRPAEGLLMPATSSQSDSQQSEARPAVYKQQTFCYRLVAPSGESSCKLIGPSPRHRPSVHYKLSDLVVAAKTPTRLTLTCKVVFTHPKAATRVNYPRSWFIVDDTSQTVSAYEGHGYSKVTVHSTCWLSPDILEELQSLQPTVVLKDVAIQNGQFICDGYSRLYPASSMPILREQLIVSNNLPTIGELKSAVPCVGDLRNLTQISAGDLVMISGKVSGVNEETAYVWEVCDRCHSDDLQPHTVHGEMLYCNKCEQCVENSVKRIHLEVYTQLQTSLQTSPIPVKVKLSQATIDRLLPEESDDEGYDVQCVLGQALGSLHCIVINTVKNATPREASRSLKEIHLEEVLLQT